MVSAGETLSDREVQGCRHSDALRARVKVRTGGDVRSRCQLAAGDSCGGFRWQHDQRAGLARLHSNAAFLDECVQVFLRCVRARPAEPCADFFARRRVPFV